MFDIFRYRLNYSRISKYYHVGDKILKICIVTTMFPKYFGDSYGPFVFEEAKFLVKKGVEVHVITQHNQGAAYEEIMDGVHVHRFRWLEPKEFKALIYFTGLIDNFRLLTYVISLFFNLIMIKRRYGIELFHAHHTIPTGLVAIMVSKIIRVPVVITAHLMDITTHGTDVGPLENIVDFESNSIFKRLIMYSMNSSKKIIAVSQDLANRIVQMGINKDITVLRNAVDINRFKPSKNMEFRHNNKIYDNDILILFIGHLETFKGIFELLYSFHRIKLDHKNIKLMVVGEGHEEEKVRNIVSKYKLDNFVIFAGKVSPETIQNYYQMADIFTLPSYTEGLPLVVIEAMACGLPVVVSTVGGIPELVKDDVNGFLVPPKDKASLTKKLKKLVDDIDLREKFGRKALETVDDEFNIDKKVDKLIEIYQGMVK